MPKHILEVAIHRALGSLFALAPRVVPSFAELMLLGACMAAIEKPTFVRFVQVDMHTLIYIVIIVRGCARVNDICWPPSN